MSSGSSIRRTAAIGVLALLLAGGQGVAGAQADTAGGANTALTGAVVLNGTPAVATVTVVAWPGSQELESLKEGEVVDTKVIDHFRTSKEGRFSIAIDPLDLAPSHLGQDG
ncbi:MAG: hypothetical protein KIT69_21515, partial [Propionibacteriaceae bacterium]|nr:hypothetical protein [Propionibacteriaceae bacterium]